GIERHVPTFHRTLVQRAVTEFAAADSCYIEHRVDAAESAQTGFDARLYVALLAQIAGMIAGIREPLTEAAAMLFRAANHENRLTLRGGGEGGRFCDSGCAGEEKHSSHESILHPNPLVRSHGLVTGVENTGHDVPVFVGLAGRDAVPRAFDEMAHL